MILCENPGLEELVFKPLCEPAKVLWPLIFGRRRREAYRSDRHKQPSINNCLEGLFIATEACSVQPFDSVRDECQEKAEICELHPKELVREIC
jgi:hypothetical protein